MANIKARRALSDLFRKGTEVRIGPGPDGPLCEVGPFLRDNGERLPPTDDQVVMWITPADPLQREQALREANAKRAASIVRAKREPESEEHLTAMAFLADLGDETLVDYVILGDGNLHQAQAEREILANDEWKDMASYQDAMRQFQNMDPSELEGNEDWEALLELDEKYGEQVRQRSAELADTQREILRAQVRRDRASVEKMALSKRAELAASSVFMGEYDRWMTYYAVREFEDNSKLFFENPDELTRQPQEVKELIATALIPFISDAGEAKNSQGAADGSDSSVPPRKPETSESSTPVGQTA